MLANKLYYFIRLPNVCQLFFTRYKNLFKILNLCCKRKTFVI